MTLWNSTKDLSEIASSLAHSSIYGTGDKDTHICEPFLVNHAFASTWETGICTSSRQPRSLETDVVELVVRAAVNDPILATWVNHLTDLSIPFVFLNTPRFNFIVHFKLHSITPMATKVHVILWSFVVVTWMHDIIELV